MQELLLRKARQLKQDHVATVLERQLGTMNQHAAAIRAEIDELVRRVAELRAEASAVPPPAPPPPPAPLPVSAPPQRPAYVPAPLHHPPAAPAAPPPPPALTPTPPSQPPPAPAGPTGRSGSPGIGVADGDGGDTDVAAVTQPPAPVLLSSRRNSRASVASAAAAPHVPPSPAQHAGSRRGSTAEVGGASPVDERRATEVPSRGASPAPRSRRASEAVDPASHAAATTATAAGQRRGSSAGAPPAPASPSTSTPPRAPSPAPRRVPTPPPAAPPPAPQSTPPAAPPPQPQQAPAQPPRPLAAVPAAPRPPVPATAPPPPRPAATPAVLPPPPPTPMQTQSSHPAPSGSGSPVHGLSPPLAAPGPSSSGAGSSRAASPDSTSADERGVGRVRASPPKPVLVGGDADDGVLVNPSLSWASHGDGMLTGTPVMVMSPAGPVQMLMTPAGVLVPYVPTPASHLTSPAMFAPPTHTSHHGGGISRGSRGLVASPGLVQRPLATPGPVPAISSALPSPQPAASSVSSPMPLPEPTLSEFDGLVSDASIAPPLPGLGDPPAVPSEVVTASLSRRAAPQPHSLAAVMPDAAAAQAAVTVGVMPPGSRPAPPSGQLGSFMYVKNSRFDASRPTPDNPRFWVGRIAEIMRGGRVRLHWHRETELGSGLYIPTNNYFPERSALLRPFKAAGFDPSKRAWQVFPVVERLSPDEEAASAKLAGSVTTVPGGGEDDAAGGGGGVPGVKPGGTGPQSDAEDIVIGSFVFLRNARFRGDAETTDMPRYWVARVTGTAVPPAALLGGGAAGGGKGMGAVQSLASPDGKLRLQWMKETSVGSHMYTATTSLFYEPQRLCRLVPGGMQYDGMLQVWRRGSDDVRPPPLIFPGDESLIAAKSTVAARLTAPGSGPLPESLVASIAAPSLPPPDIVSLPEPPVPLATNLFGFVRNGRYDPAPERQAPLNPRFWVARVLEVLPDGTNPNPRVRVQWFVETGIGTKSYKETPKVFLEALANFRPLREMVFDAAASTWQRRVPFNEAATFQYTPPEPPRPPTPPPQTAFKHAEPAGAGLGRASFVKPVAATPATVPAATPAASATSGMGLPPRPGPDAPVGVSAPQSATPQLAAPVSQPDGEQRVPAQDPPVAAATPQLPEAAQRETAATSSVADVAPSPVQPLPLAPRPTWAPRPPAPTSPAPAPAAAAAAAAAPPSTETLPPVAPLQPPPTASGPRPPRPGPSPALPAPDGSTPAVAASPAATAAPRPPRPVGPRAPAPPTPTPTPTALINDASAPASSGPPSPGVGVTATSPSPPPLAAPSPRPAGPAGPTGRPPLPAARPALAPPRPAAPTPPVPAPPSAPSPTFPSASASPAPQPDSGQVPSSAPPLLPASTAAVAAAHAMPPPGPARRLRVVLLSCNGVGGAVGHSVYVRLAASWTGGIDIDHSPTSRSPVRVSHVVAGDGTGMSFAGCHYEWLLPDGAELTAVAAQVVALPPEPSAQPSVSEGGGGGEEEDA